MTLGINCSFNGEDYHTNPRPTWSRAKRNSAIPEFHLALRFIESCWRQGQSSSTPRNAHHAGRGGSQIQAIGIERDLKAAGIDRVRGGTHNPLTLSEF